MSMASRPENGSIRSNNNLVLWGTRIRLTRRASGMSATEFAKTVGLGRQQILKIELGRMNPSTELLDSIYSQLGACAGDLQELPKTQLTEWMEGKRRGIGIRNSVSFERPIPGLRRQLERVESGLSTVSELGESLSWHARRVDELTGVIRAKSSSALKSSQVNLVSEEQVEQAHSSLKRGRGRREKDPVIPTRGEIPLGAIIRIRRRMLGLSIRDLAVIAGDYPGSQGDYSQNTISQFEQTGAGLNREALERIAEALGSTTDELRRVTRDQLIQWRNTMPKLST